MFIWPIFWNVYSALGAGRRRLPPELSILGVMIGMMLLFEALGWIFVGQSFIANPLRLKIMILQEAEIGIIAVGVTQVIIMGGIDLSSGSVVGMTAMIAASLAQVAGYSHPIIRASPASTRSFRWRRASCAALSSGSSTAR